jgi:hypothetical protein
MGNRPPTHEMDHVITYVRPNDPAWDHAKRARDLRIIAGEEKNEAGEKIESPWANDDEHPMARYFAGHTRFDLETVREYLLDNVKPMEFKLRRIEDLDDWGEICDHLKRGREYKARTMAIALSLVKVVGLDLELRKPKDRPTAPLRNQILQELRHAIGERQFNLLGAACINANTALEPDEKKPEALGMAEDG